MMAQDYKELFANNDLFESHFRKLANKVHKIKECNHDFKDVVSFDESSTESVCNLCGVVVPSQTVGESEKLSGCMSLEEFMNVRYGPATPHGLQSFLLPMPTDKKLKMRDQFLDLGILNNLRIYTNLERIAAHCGIPSFLVSEAMRSLMRTGIGAYSDHLQVNTLRRVIHAEMYYRKGMERLLTALDAYEKDALEPRKETTINSKTAARSAMMRCIK